MANVTGASLSDIYDRLHAAAGYHPFESETFTDWSLEAGDTVTVRRGSETYQSPVHAARMVWKGAPQTTISATGTKQRDPVAKISRRKYARGGAGMQTQKGIYSDIYSEDGYIHSVIEQTASSIRSEVGYTISGMAHSIIEQTATYIRTEVENAASAISASVIEQTAEYVRTEVSSVASGVAWSVVEQTMTGIEQKIGSRARVFIGWYDPALSHDDLIDGDLWYKRPNSTTWNELSGMTWNEISAYKWKDLYGTEHYVRKNGAWIKVLDTATVVESEVTIEQDREHWAAVAKQVDLQGEVYESNLSVTAQKISSNVEQKEAGLNSRITQTASQIRSEVSDTKNGLQSSITQTASQIRSEVSDTKNGLQSSITQTASQIRSEVSDTKNSLQSSITQTASQIRSEVSDTKNSLQSSITQTASQIRSEVSDTKNSLQSSITQTASQIRSEVSDTKNSLQSSITTQANRISLVVEGTGANAKVKAAQIVAAINDGESTVIISADHINLDGYVKATDLTTNWLSAKIADISVVNVNGITSQNNVVAGGYAMSPVYYIGTPGNAKSFSDAVTDIDISLSNNTYTLKKKIVSNGDSWVDVGTFSRATTLSGAWSGGKLTVSASPQGNTFKADLFTGGHWGYAQGESSTTYYGSISAKHNGGDTSYSTGEYFNVDASSIYTSGHTDGLSDYYNSSYWAKATEANNWQAKVPNITNTAAQDWDCGAADAFQAGRSSATPSVSYSSTGFVNNTNNLPGGTKSRKDDIKTAIVNNRSQQGYNYIRIKVNSSYYVYYWVNNGNGWTS